MRDNLLIVENEHRMREVVMMMLSDLPLKFFEARNGLEAIDIFDQETINIVITDLKLPKLNGMEVLRHINEHDPEIPVIVITAYGSIDNAVEAIRCGAFDYVTKPFKEERLKACVKKALKISKLTFEVRHLRHEIEKKYNFDRIIGSSPAICEVLKMAGEVAKTDTTVLITGESGTGKELLSRAIHVNSRCASGPFIPLNCAAIPPDLLESEMFGFESGAFTGANRRQKGKIEIANGGTLFLDEIGDMIPEVQGKLLRVLESYSFQRLGGTKYIDVNTRVIAATNKDFNKLFEQERFRKDLYYRISVFPIHIPPLRERPEDIPLLVNYFIKKFSAALGRKTPKISEKAQKSLAQRTWPGNVRELKNVIEKALILCQGDRITEKHLTNQDAADKVPDKLATDKFASFLMGEEGIDILQLESMLIRHALKKTQNNVSEAARLLHLSRATLRYRLEKYNIDL
jgi:DNA-binding NtrC family response regulator